MGQDSADTEPALDTPDLMLAEDEAIIGLFPLDLVLLPGQPLPLRIFEPRYKQLLDDCALDERPFGVCLADPANEVLGWTGPRLVGCAARLTEVQELGTNLQVEAVGTRRFEVIEVIEPALPPLEDGEELVFPTVEALLDRVEEEGRPAPLGLPPKLYLRAHVRWLDAPTGRLDPARWARVAVRLAERVRLICHLLGLDEEETQRVMARLAMDDEVPGASGLYRLGQSLQPPAERLQAMVEARTLPDLLETLAVLVGEGEQPPFEGLRFDLEEE